jgi:anti-sigma-K factor RskA
MAPFLFETNQIFGFAATIEHWKQALAEFKRAYPTMDPPYACRVSMRCPHSFGLHKEHAGEKTLGDFFDENKMQRIQG